MRFAIGIIIMIALANKGISQELTTCDTIWVTTEGIAWLNGDCGWWKPVDMTGPWLTLVTDPNRIITGSNYCAAGWITGSVIWDRQMTTYAVECPCGCPSPATGIQRRICPVTDVHQERTVSREWRYFPIQRNSYEAYFDNIEKVER